jgi:hypothetical protein
MPPPDFIGRDDEISELMGSFDRGATITGVRGLGGIGKTTLAFKLAWLLRERYPDGQLMMDMRGTSKDPLKPPLTPAEAIGHIIHVYNEEERLPENEDELLRRYFTVMNRKRALLLLDNASGFEQVKPLVPLASCGIIITSRRRFTLPGLVAKDLDTLMEDRAVELLFEVWRPRAEPPADQIGGMAGKEVAQLCGFLPLALRAAGSLLANTPDLSLVEYAKKLRDERTRLEQIGSEGVDLGVEASFNLSYRQLPKDTARVLRLLSIFPVDFDAKAEEAICKDLGHMQLSELLRWSLVEYQEKARRYHLHDLVRIFAAARLDEEDSVTEHTAVQQRYAEYYRDILSVSNKLYAAGKERTADGLGLFDREWSNIKVGQAWSEKNAAISNETSDLCCVYRHYLEIK